MKWSQSDQDWIRKTDRLFTSLFGPDFCQYEYTKPSNRCILSPGQIFHDEPDFTYSEGTDVDADDKGSCCDPGEPADIIYGDGDADSHDHCAKVDVICIDNDFDASSPVATM